VYAPEIARAEKHRESVMAQSLEREQRNAKLQEALASLPESERARLEPVIRASIAGVPANVAQVMFAPKESKPTRREFVKETGQIIDLDTGEVVGLKGYERPPKEQKGEGEQPVKVPASDRRSMTELESSVKELDNAIKAVEASPDAFGLKTILPNPVLSRQGGVKPRADVTGAIVKLRRTEFGTAMSKQEAASGVSLFPSIGGMTGGDNPAAITDKLTSLKEKALLELNTKREFYGMKPFELNAAATPTAQTGGGAANIDAARYKSDPKYKAWVDSRGGR